MTPALAMKVGRILPLLGSDRDGEVLAAVAALRRTLGAARLDLNDLAAELRQPVQTASEDAQQHRKERASRASRTPPLPAETLRLLRAAMRLDILSQWETTFAASIIDAAQRSTWRPSRRQSEILARLTGKAQEAEAHP